MATKKKQADIDVAEIKQGVITFCMVGVTPLILNSMSAKAKQTLLLPEAHRRKTEAERARAPKHDPISEYRESMYYTRGGDTRLCIPAPAFKGAIMTAALRMSGQTKTAVGQLTWVQSTHVPVYGIPRMLMSVVRSADQARTPDVRTRAIIPEWACTVSISFVEPNLSAGVMAGLMHSAGLIAGVGDFRQEKTKGNYGQWRLCAETDAEYRRIKKAGGAAAQRAAIETPEYYDDETKTLYEWFAETSTADLEVAA